MKTNTFVKIFKNALVAFSLLISTQVSAGNLLINGSFETGDFTGWTVEEPTSEVGAPGVGAHDGDFAAELKGAQYQQFGVYTIRQSFLANPGDEFSLSGFMLSENEIMDPGFAILKIIFRDANGVDLEPASISTGIRNTTGFPGIEGTPSLNVESQANSWVYTQAQGTAPDGAVEVQFIALNIDIGGAFETSPIWFDDIEVAVFPIDYTESQIIDAENIVKALTPGDVTTQGNQKAFENFLTQAMRELKKGNADKALKKIEHAISKSDGCANQGSPDGKGKDMDWITNCDAQLEVYERLIVARTHLEE